MTENFTQRNDRNIFYKISPQSLENAFSCFFHCEMNLTSLKWSLSTVATKAINHKNAKIAKRSAQHCNTAQQKCNITAKIATKSQLTVIKLQRIATMSKNATNRKMSKNCNKIATMSKIAPSKKSPHVSTFSRHLSLLRRRRERPGDAATQAAQVVQRRRRRHDALQAGRHERSTLHHADHLLREGQWGGRGQGQEGPEAAGVRQADQRWHAGLAVQFC